MAKKSKNDPLEYIYNVHTHVFTIGHVPDGFLGLIMDGRRYDIGLPDYYLDTLINYRHD